MCKLRGIIWYIFHANRMLLKIWPHLTFGWPFVNISLTIHPTHNKLYIFVILITARVMWYTWKVIWSILKFWPLLDLCVTRTGKGPNRSKFCQNIFWPITTLKQSITHFRQNGTWVLQFWFINIRIEKMNVAEQFKIISMFPTNTYENIHFRERNSFLVLNSYNYDGLYGASRSREAFLMILRKVYTTICIVIHGKERLMSWDIAVFRNHDMERIIFPLTSCCLHILHVYKYHFNTEYPGVMISQSAIIHWGSRNRLLLQTSKTFQILSTIKFVG